MTREQIEALQVERLKETIARCMKNPIYKQRLDPSPLSRICARTILSVWHVCL